MMNHFYLNDDHTYRCCSLTEWSEQIDKLYKENKKHLAYDIINGKLVSTIWLGLNHNHHGGRPLLFETMVFSEEQSGHDIYMDRYTTWHEAIVGHKKAVQWVLDGCKDE